MINVFNRKQLLITMDKNIQLDVCKKLTTKGIDYQLKTINMQSTNIMGSQRGRMGSYGVNQAYTYEYTIYVHKNDYDYANSILNDSSLQIQ